ncbi:MAG: DUF434 domain-containing protein [Bacteroidota bacterium]
MPSKQRHRGQHAEDARLFGEAYLPSLREAVSDMGFLLSRGYSDSASLKLVGDRHKLTQRQRKALLRVSCPEEAVNNRPRKQVSATDLSAQTLAIDGYNLLITIESALAGGMLFHCRDGCYRDIASVHGTYRKVEETLPALKLIGDTLLELGVEQANWFLDKPVSNSGKLKLMMIEVAKEHAFPWWIELVNNPDRTISELTDQIAISSDGWVIDHGVRWFNLQKHIVDQIEGANVIKL